MRDKFANDTGVMWSSHDLPYGESKYNSNSLCISNESKSILDKTKKKNEILKKD